MSRGAERKSSEEMRVVEGVLSKIATDPRIAPTTSEATRTAAWNDYEKTLKQVIDLPRIPIRDIDRTLRYLNLRAHPTLTPSEVANNTQVLYEIRDREVELEAEEAAERVFKRQNRNRWLATLPAIAPTLAFLFTASQTVSAFSDYGSAQSRLSLDPNYLISQHYYDAASSLSGAVSNLSGGYALIPEARNNIGRAIGELESLKEPTQNLKDIQQSLKPEYDRKTDLKAMTVPQMGEIAQIHIETKAKAKTYEIKAPAELLLQRDSAWNRFWGWAAASGGLLVLGVGLAMPKEVYKKINQEVKKDSKAKKSDSEATT